MRERAAFAVPFARPLVPPPAAWLPFLEASYENRWFTNGGPVGARLERELEHRSAVTDREAVLVSSATAGLTATLLALGVEGAVAVPAFTFPASAHAVRLAGCRPVLCDVDPATWELTPAAAHAAVRDHGCTAIMHVRPFGFCRDLSGIERSARELGVPLVVDSAAAFGGTTDDGLPVGGAGDAEVFSFHATKVFAVGEGGAVVADPALAAQIRRTINFSLSGTDVAGPGLNGKLSDMAAAVGLAMLRRLDEHIAVRRAAVERLAKAVTGAAALPAAPGRPPWQGLPVLAPDRAARDAAVAALHADGIEARVYYAPGLHRTTAFAPFATAPLPVTDAICDRIVCLPVHSDLDGQALYDVADAVSRAFGTVAAPRALVG
ncbi:MAG TPA: aminotransferase class I/II-fold pyridoxal phosphate-dependent enzyme [Solirubrobacteraceae bacterium]|nr:aminotransferase class I/II-fold pyridoxal phosphate-dependent enzyme [Solirubrobacteraceae bacterium]